MSYAVKEIHSTIQGEGFHAGRACVLLRFAGCNLWSGREQDRASAVCQFCDTDFVGMDGEYGGRYDAQALAQQAVDLYPGGGAPYVVLTGGEPLLQVDQPLIEAFHRKGCEVAVESNGTIEAPSGLDWICISPKAGAELTQTTGDELKLVYPQTELMPEQLPSLEFDYWYLQPMDGPQLRSNMQAAAEYCRQHPKWKLSIQLHKVVGLK